MPFPSDSNPDTEVFALIDAEVQRQDAPGKVSRRERRQVARQQTKEKKLLRRR